MENKNAINTTLKYQCRHDARRRFMQPNSCQKAPLRLADGSIKPECLTCPGPMDITKTVKEPATMPNKETKDTLDSLAALGLEPTPELKLNLPKAQMCSCGRGYADPRADNRRGVCKQCKKEHKKAALLQQPAKAVKVQAAACKADEIKTTIPVPPAAEQAKAVKLCKYCNQPAIIRKDGISLGLCPACQTARSAGGNAIRNGKNKEKVKPNGEIMGKSATVVLDEFAFTNTPGTPDPVGTAVGNPAKPEFITNNNGYDGSIPMAEFCRVPIIAAGAADIRRENFADMLIGELLENIHDYVHAISYESRNVDLGLARILVKGDMLYKLSNERQSKND